MMQISSIIEKELKIKMRGWRAPALITAYLLFLGLVIFIIFKTTRTDMYSNSFNPRTALSSYYALATIQLFMLMFIIPAMTGGAISGERERQTLDLLLCTNLSPLSIVAGKVVVSIAHIMLLIAASLPILASVFLYGGVQITELLALFGFYLVTAMMLGSMGMFFSTIFKKSSVAIVISYLTLMFIIFGTAIIYAIWNVIYSSTYNKPLDYQYALYCMFPNPLMGFGSILEGSGSSMSIVNIFSSIVGSRLYGSGSYPALPQIWGIEIQPWMLNIAFDIVITALFIFLGAWKIKPVKKGIFRRRKKRQLTVEN